MTNKRIERGPDAANDELSRWRKERRRRELHAEMRKAFRPVAIYGDAAAMRRDALKSRGAGVGSRVLARDAEPRGIGALDVAISLVALGGGFLLGRWLVRRKKARAQAPVSVHGQDGNAYVVGAYALAAK